MKRSPGIVIALAIACLLFRAARSNAQVSSAGVLSWARQAGGAEDDFGNAVAALPDGRFLLAGSFSGTATFGAGESQETTLESAGKTDIFIARHGADGSLVWVKQAGGGADDRAWSMDALPDGGCVVTGSFFVAATFGKGEPGKTNLLSKGYDDAFVARFRPDGTLAWAKNAGGALTDIGYGVGVLEDGAALVTGVFSLTATFGDEETSQTLLTSAGNWDLFVARYNPDGALAWARRAGGTDWEYDRDLAVFPDGGSLISGEGVGVLTFGPGEPGETVLDLPEHGAFFARYRPDGTLAWAKAPPATGWSTGFGIATLPDGSALEIGRFQDSIKFGEGEGGETTLYGHGGTDSVFLARFNPDGTLAWAKEAGGDSSSQAEGYDAVLFPDGSSAATGFYRNSVTFGRGESGETRLTSGDADNMFVARYNANGTLAWVKHARGGGDDQGWSVDALSGQGVVATGDFVKKTTFGYGENRQTVLQSKGGTDIVLARYSGAGWPWLDGAAEHGAGLLRLTWSYQCQAPARFLGFAYDIYRQNWVDRGWEETLWFPFPAADRSGDVDLGFSGGYHAWISNQYAEGDWFACPNPWTGIVYGGVPHGPRDARTEALTSDTMGIVPAEAWPNVRLRWAPEIFGTWLYQIIVYKVGAGFVEAQGPGGLALWHFIDYGGTAYPAGAGSYFEGWADFTLPPGAYWLSLRAVGWDGATAGEFAAAYAEVPEGALNATDGARPE